MCLREFVVHTDLYTLLEMDTPLYTNGLYEALRSTVVRFWGVIGRGPFGRSKARVSCIVDLIYRYLHRLIATSIAS
ncbi:hypothetical protein Hanom_Chr03g00228721 [Helianthus anomalus]